MLAAVLLFPVSVAGQQPRPTLEQVEAIAVRDNQDVRLARLRVDSTSGEQRLAKALPNPTLSGVPGSPYQYTVGLPFDLSLQRLYRTRAGGQGREAAVYDLEDVLRLVRFAVRRAYYDLLMAGALEDLARSQRDIFRQLLAADSIRVRAGDIPERNLVRGELELSRAEAELTQASTARRASRLALQALMGVARPDTAFEVTGELRYLPIEVSADSLRAWAYQSRPDLRAALRRVDQARALKSLAGAAVMPVPFLTLAWQMGTPFTPGAWSFGNNGVYALGFGFQVPLFDWNGGGRQRAEAGVQSALVNDDRTRLQVESDIAVALDQFQASKSLVLRYQTGLLDRARTSLDQSRYAYQAGATSFVDLLDAIRTFGDTQSDYFHALHDYWVGAWALSGAVGKDLIPR